MFVLGFHFPADEGNIIADDKVVAKLDAAVDLSSAKEVEILVGKNGSDSFKKIGTDSFLGKALVHYYQSSEEIPDKNGKYLVYTNKYQISELSKRLDGASTKEITKMFDGMEPVRIKVA